MMKGTSDTISETMHEIKSTLTRSATSSFINAERNKTMISTDASRTLTAARMIESGIKRCRMNRFKRRVTFHRFLQASTAFHRLLYTFREAAQSWNDFKSVSEEQLSFIKKVCKCWCTTYYENRLDARRGFRNRGQ